MGGRERLGDEDAGPVRGVGEEGDICRGCAVAVRGLLFDGLSCGG